MGRSGYTDYDDETFPNATYLYRANLDRAMASKRGQAFLKDLLTRLDAMPVKRLATNQLDWNGEVCTLGVMTRARGIETTSLREFEFDDDEYDDHNERVIDNLVAELDIAEPMVREIMFMNDEGTCKPETPEMRWQRMRRWVESRIKP